MSQTTRVYRIGTERKKPIPTGWELVDGVELERASTAADAIVQVETRCRANPLASYDGSQFVRIMSIVPHGD